QIRRHARSPRQRGGGEPQRQDRDNEKRSHAHENLLVVHVAPTTSPIRSSTAAYSSNGSPSTRGARCPVTPSTSGPCSTMNARIALSCCTSNHSAGGENPRSSATPAASAYAPQLLTPATIR